MKTIFLPLDGSTFGEHALPFALAIARHGAMRLVLAHAHNAIIPVVGPEGAYSYDPHGDDELRAQESAYLQDVAGRVAAVWDGPVSQAMLEAPLAEALCSDVRSAGAALIVLSSHARGGIARAMFGSVADELIRHAPTPALVVHPGPGAPDLSYEPSLRHIVIPLDGSPFAEEAVGLAVWLGRLTGARYTLLRVIEPVKRGFLIDGARPTIDDELLSSDWRRARDDLERVAGPLRAQGLVVSTEVRVGSPAAEIVEGAGAACGDLVAMTTHGRGGIARMMLGSVADAVLRGGALPLLVAHPRTES